MDNGETRLVELKPFDLEAIRTAQHEQANEQHACEHGHCPNAGEPYYLRMYDEEVNMWLCPDHAYEHGFCSGCHLFSAGFESFDFSPLHLCAACVEDIEGELYDGGNSDLDFGWEYPSAWYDPDMDIEPPETPRSVDMRGAGE